jgi:phosphatidylserine/phosphatidylglycerophosphate/cardiolipin synthase-like enzyme
MAGGVDIDALLVRLDETLADTRLSDEERRSLVSALRDASPPEEGLRQLRNRAFELVRERTHDAAALSLLKWLEGVVRSLDVGRTPREPVRTEVFFSPGQGCLQLIQRQLRGARRSLDLCVFTLSDDRIAHEILAAHRRGVTVRLLTDNEKEFDAGSDVALLRGAGVGTVVDRSSAHMHHKFAIVDGAWLLNGSYNWTRSACEFNEENLVVSNDPALVGAFADQVEQLGRRLS